MKNILIALSIYCYCISFCLAQSPSQTIKGVVIDQDSRQPLIGATVMIENSDPSIGTSTDINGAFRLENVPVGRHQIRCQYLGYQVFLSDNIILNSAKELIVNITLIEAGHTTDEVVVTAFKHSNEALNTMSIVSTRSFSVEETQRYAASANDPSRMAMGFPGVQASRDSRSDIVIRGNSGIGLLWRLEGIDIPNPNHFARKGSSGGGITVFSVSMLDNSDFSTGAFAAEYGNAFSGVFDIHFRKGNKEKREHSFRAGLLGLDFSTEGPIKKGRSSYLINYRYSTLGLLNKMGVHLVGPRVDNNFQDLSINLYFPSENNKSTFTLWGIGGLSDEFSTTDGDDPQQWQVFSDYLRRDFQTDMGAIGATHSYLINDQSFIKTSAAVMGQKILFINDTLDLNKQAGIINEERYENVRYSLASHYSNKINSKLSLKTGLFLSNLSYDLFYQKAFAETPTTFTKIIDEKGSSLLVQPYAQMRYHPSPKWTLSAGIHTLFFSLNDTYSIEPRLAVKYDISEKSNLSFAYGKHGRILPIGSYFTQVENTMPNLELDIIQSHHFVLAFEQGFKNNMRLRTEAYFQNLFNVPVSADTNSTYSILNATDGFATEALVNKGEGKNIGLDITLEQGFKNGFFFLFSGSIFNSTYSDVSGKFYNTRYNSNIAGTFMGGKEWTLKKGGVFQAGLKLLANQGARKSPLINGAPASRFDREAPWDESRPFEVQVAPYFRPDIRLSYRKDNPNSAWTIALDVQNVIGRDNEDGLDYSYDSDANEWTSRSQSGLTPILSFQIDF